MMNVKVRRSTSMGTIRITRVITYALRDAVEPGTYLRSADFPGRNGGKGFRILSSRDTDREIAEELDRIQNDPGDSRLEHDLLVRLPQWDVRHIGREARLDLPQDLSSCGRVRLGRLRFDLGVHRVVVVPVSELSTPAGRPVQERKHVIVRVEVVREPAEEEDVEVAGGAGRLVLRPLLLVDGDGHHAGGLPGSLQGLCHIDFRVSVMRGRVPQGEAQLARGAVARLGQ